ncbi:uncharacterized protein LOC102803470 [Saccoglossus kowalevskii]|uniref:Uncharacterized protein LOC102805101 n=1 Tax=Saccoglossus kowalevskii TaxID=10224 RepID=A0ABM0LWB4_SACKO|nr:PREDICTED: uncharacterized protein LOC102805101 [Saccoglossus kowalevskii]
MGRKIQGIFVRLQHEKENMTSIVHEMGLDKSVLDRSIVNWGNVIRLKRAFREVIETGRVLKIGIMGGSVSAVNVYPRLLEKALKRILDSDVSIYNGAIGATDSQYYAYCMRNHLDTQNLDIIIWELAVNDFLKGVSPSGQEEITRQVIELPNKPQLLYVNFLFGKQIAKKSCNNSEDTGGRELSMYYAVPSISLSKAACRRIKAGKADDLLGGVNKNHLSSKAHLQMELFLRYFMVNVLSNVTWEILESKTSLSSEVMTEVEHVPGPLPPTYFMDTRVTKPKCWSALLPQLGIGEYLWPIRAADGWDKVPVHSDSGDRKQVWVGSKNGSVIRFPISIEPYENLTSKLAISTFTCENCGSVRAIVDNDFARAATISGRSQHRITWPTVIATDLEPGSHNITIKCLSDDPFHLAAIATAYDLTTPLSIFT